MSVERVVAPCLRRSAECCLLVTVTSNSVLRGELLLMSLHICTGEHSGFPFV